MMSLARSSRRWPQLIVTAGHVWVTTASLTVMACWCWLLLPAMAHLMYQGARDVLVRAADKGVGIQGQPIGAILGISPVTEAVIGKIPVAVRYTLQRNQAGRELTVKELRIKPLIRPVKPGVFIARDLPFLVLCHVTPPPLCFFV
jgi:hypothetical protein